MGVITRLDCQAFGMTHQGMIRDHNEDAFFENPALRLWAVADGMGGHSRGDYASQKIVENLKQFDAGPLIGCNSRQLTHLLTQTNQQLCEAAAKKSGTVIGSTVVLLYLHPPHGVCLWAGDSRLYRFRNQQLKQISRDHSYMNLFHDQLRHTDQDLPDYTQIDALTRAVGADQTLDVEGQMLNLEDNDVFLLCSDGLNKEMADDEIKDVLQTQPFKNCAQALLNIALTRGARDNVTVVVVHYKKAAA